MSWEKILKRDWFFQVEEALEEAKKRAKETGKTQYVIAEWEDGETEYTIHTEDISKENPTLMLYEKVEPQKPKRFFGRFRE